MTLPVLGVIFSIFIRSVYRNGLEDDSIGSKTSKKKKKRENRETGGKQLSHIRCDSASPRWLLAMIGAGCPERRKIWAYNEEQQSQIPKNLDN